MKGRVLDPILKSNVIVREAGMSQKEIKQEIKGAYFHPLLFMSSE